MPAKPLIPNCYVNSPASFVYDADFSDAHFRTYVRLRGLAWQSKSLNTPPLTIAELAAICHRSERSMWGHLKVLRERTDLTWSSVGNGRMVFQFDPLQSFALDPLQNFAVANDHGVVVDPSARSEPQHHHHPNHDAPLQNFAVAEGEGVQANLEALETYGVNTRAESARGVAGLEHVTSELVHAWGERLQEQPGVRNLPGLLLYKLRTNTQPPRTDERRGGLRTSRSDGVEQAAVTLPDELREQLDYLGLRGEKARQEIARAWAEDPERVEGWVRHIAADEGLGAGLLLSMVRSGEPVPPCKAPDGPENRRRYVKGRYREFIRY